MKKIGSKLGQLCIIASLLFCDTSTAFAQRSDFSGTWMLKERSSLTGQDYANGVPKQIKITQYSDSMIIERTALDQNGEDLTTSEVLRFNGEASVSTTPLKNIKSSTLKWPDGGHILVEISKLSTPGQK